MDENNVTDQIPPQESSIQNIVSTQSSENTSIGIGQIENTLIIVGLVFLMAILGGGAYLLGAIRQHQQKTSPPSITRSALQNTDSWIVESNSQERYYLKHPSDWKVSKDTGGYLLSLVSPTSGLSVILQQISSGSKEEIRNNLIKEKNNMAEYNRTSQTVQYNYTFEEKMLGQNTVFLVKRLVLNPKSGYNDYIAAFVLNDTEVAQFMVTQNYTDPNIAQIINTIYSTFRYDASLEGKNISFQSKELDISFDYPSELRSAEENPASHGKGGSQNKGEEWWRIDFNKTGFEPGYYEVSASTSNYTPSSWEGSPHWINTKIAMTDTEGQVKQKLSAANWQIIKVQKTNSSKDVQGFKVWTLDCYVGCELSKVYVIPLQNSKYNNLVIYTILENLNAGNENTALEQARNLALTEITMIENNQSDTTIKKYLDGQELIFNSLTISGQK